MLYIVLILVGVGIGVIITSISKHQKPVGLLRVDHSDPDDEPYLFLELSRSTSVREICSKDYVTLQVKVENYISHE